jgi:hypothetical protein
MPVVPVEKGQIWSGARASRSAKLSAAEGIVVASVLVLLSEASAYL